MGFLSFLSKSKLKREIKYSEGDELDIPMVPPSEELPIELPTFPTAEEMGLKEEKKSEREAAEVIPYVEEEEIKAYESEKRELEDRSHSEITKPVFIRADLYKSIVDEINLIKGILKESEDALVDLEDVKNDEKRSFERWHSQLEDMQRKLIFVDRTLFGKEM